VKDERETAEICEPNQCPLCGQPNGCPLCGTSAYKGPCWCTSVSIPDELLLRVPEDMRNRACICQACVVSFWNERIRGGLVPRPDEFYLEETGLLVFTAAVASLNVKVFALPGTFQES
jgi:hypothetical protein